MRKIYFTEYVIKGNGSVRYSIVKVVSADKTKKAPLFTTKEKEQYGISRQKVKCGLADANNPISYYQAPVDGLYIREWNSLGNGQYQSSKEIKQVA